MIEHESDLWPARRWAASTRAVDDRVYVRPFPTESERDAWVAENSGSRRAVGKRHPAVKSLRQRWRQEALKRLAEWRART